jgi:iron complex outermembrane receptor protein
MECNNNPTQWDTVSEHFSSWPQQGGHMTSKGVRVSGAVSLAICAALGRPVAAAEAGAEQPDSDSSQVLETIVVTAQRREENLSRVPISIQAFSQADLDSKALKSLGDIAAITPGVSFRPVGYTNWFTIRGISQNAGGGVAGLGPNTTALYIDEAPIQARYNNAAVPTTIPFVFDVERIEVLRGPQGTLFGASAQGGAIRIISRRPSLTEYSGFARAEFGEISGGGRNTELGGAIGGPLIPGKLGFRISGWARNEGGWVDQDPALLGQLPASRVPRGQIAGDTLPGLLGGLKDSDVNRGDKYAARIALLWQPTDAVEIEPAIYYQSRNQNSADLFDPTVGNPAGGDFVSSRAMLQPVSDELYSPSLKVSVDFGRANLTSVTTYINRKNSQGWDYTTVIPPAFGWRIPRTIADAEPNTNSMDQTNFTQEFRLQSSGDDRLRWTLGLYYAKIKQHDFQTLEALTWPQLWLANTGTPLPIPLVDGKYSYVSDQFVNDTQKAVFAHVDFDLSDRFSIFGGARYEQQENDYRTTAAGPLVGPASDRRAETSGNVTSPKLGLNWRVSEDTLVYTSASKGYRPGGAGIPVTLDTAACKQQLAVVGSSADYKADSLWSYELGVKSQLMDRRLAVEGSIFRINWTDIISSIFVPACATSLPKNLGKATSEGFDLSLRAILSEGWSGSLNVGYTKARYSSNTVLFGNTIARAGQAISDIPPWTITAELAYRRPISSGFVGYGRLDSRYTSKNKWKTPAQDSTTSAYDAFATTNPAVNTVNLRVGVETAGGSDVSLFATNLLDENPILNKNIFLVNITSGAFTIPPRTVGLSYNYRW